MTQKFDALVRRVVEGQVKSFINDHPEVITTGVATWKTPPGKTRQAQLMDSIAKRVILDLTCEQTKAKLAEALAPSSEA